MAAMRPERDLRTRSDLLASGATDKEIARRMRSGDLVRTYHGVFAAGDPAPSTGPAPSTRLTLSTDPAPSTDALRRRADYERLVRATVLRSGDPVVSHLSALALLGLPIIDVPSWVHVTVPRGSGGQRRGVVHRHPCPIRRR